MYIHEMADGSVVSLEVKNKEGKELMLSTQVIGSYDGGEYKMIMVEPLRHNGQILIFNSVTCYASVANIADNKVYKFRLLAVIKREKDGEPYHCLVSNDDVAEENRRGAKRFSIGAKASILPAGARESLRGRVHDISASGISFIVSDSSLRVGDVVTVSFEQDMSGIYLSVVAKIVRTQENDKGTLFGCQVQKHDAKYTLLISYLMRQECRIRKP